MNAGEIFIHGRKTWRPLEVNLTPIPTIQVVTNNRGKLIGRKQKYEVSINNIRMPGENESNEQNVIRRYNENSIRKRQTRTRSTSMVEIRQSSCCSYEEDNVGVMKIIKNQRILARKVSLQWSKYSSSQASSDTGFSENTFISEPTSGRRKKYLCAKYINVWRKKASQKASASKIMGTEKQRNSCVKRLGISSPIIMPDQKQRNIDRVKMKNQEEKIREQANLIKELELARIKLEEELFAQGTRKLLKESQKKSISKIVHDEINPEEIITPRVPRYNPSKKFKDNWELVTRMELRAKERKERWERIREKKLLLEAEQEERLRLEEERRKEREEEEKKRKLMHAKEEKKRLEKMKKQMQEERLRLSELNSAAIRHHNNLLLKSSFKSFTVFLKQRRLLLLEAEIHFTDKLLRRTFINWKLFCKIEIEHRMYAAEEFHNNVLLVKSIEAFRRVHSRYVNKKQKADQFRRRRLLKSYFYQWSRYSFEKKCEMQDREEAAIRYYELSLLRRCLESWMQLPLVLFQEREKEQKLRSWCRKVKELLPDFQPSYEFS